MLRAYIDDSMDSVKQGRVLVMGGFIATPERWEKFSDEWRQRLEHAGWPVFKMNEVWARRNDITLEHAKWHYFTIRDHVPPVFLSFGRFHEGNHVATGPRQFSRSSHPHR